MRKRKIKRLLVLLVVLVVALGVLAFAAESFWLPLTTARLIAAGLLMAIAFLCGVIWQKAK